MNINENQWKSMKSMGINENQWKSMESVTRKQLFCTQNCENPDFPHPQIGKPERLKRENLKILKKTYSQYQKKIILKLGPSAGTHVHDVHRCHVPSDHTSRVS